MAPDGTAEHAALPSIEAALHAQRVDAGSLDAVVEVQSLFQVLGAAAYLRLREATEGGPLVALWLVKPAIDGHIVDAGPIHRVRPQDRVEMVVDAGAAGTPAALAKAVQVARILSAARSGRGPPSGATARGWFDVVTSTRPAWWRIPWIAPLLAGRRLRAVVVDDGLGSYLDAAHLARYEATVLRHRGDAQPRRLALKRWTLERLLGRVPVHRQATWDDGHGPLRPIGPVTQAMRAVLQRWAPDDVPALHDAVVYLSQPLEEVDPAAAAAEDDLVRQIVAAAAPRTVWIKPHPREDTVVWQGRADRLGCHLLGELDWEPLVAVEPPALVIGHFSTALVTAVTFGGSKAAATGRFLLEKGDDTILRHSIESFERLTGPMVERPHDGETMAGFLARVMP